MISFTSKFQLKYALIFTPALPRLLCEKKSHVYSDKNAVFVKDEDRNWESLLISKVLPPFHSLEITFHMVTFYVCIFAIKN